MINTIVGEVDPNVSAIIGFLSILAMQVITLYQAHLKQKADQERYREVDYKVQEVANLTEHTKSQIIDKIQENTEVSKVAFHEANQVKKAIAEVATVQVVDATCEFKREVAELKELVKALSAENDKRRSG